MMESKVDGILRFFSLLEVKKEKKRKEEKTAEEEGATLTGCTRREVLGKIT